MRRLLLLLLIALVVPFAAGQETAQPAKPAISDRTPQTESASNPWTSGDYVYDGSGNIKAIGTTASPNDAGLKDTFAYDSVARLKSATFRRAEGTASESYTYDAFGNQISRTTQRFTGSPAVTNTPVISSSNRLQSAVYDAAGNLTSFAGNYTYDAVNMMQSKIGAAGGDELYIYTADDERIAVRKQGDFSTWSWRWTPRDLDGKVLRTYETWTDPFGGSWLWVEDHVYANGSLIGADRQASEGGTRHFHLDHLGTPRLITNDSRQVIAEHDYLPFGIELTPLRQEVALGYAHEEPMKFTGHERDFTGGTAVENTNYLDYMHARYYAPGLGRFLTVDPKNTAIPSSPQSWNRYAYVRNNPLTALDPDGEEEITIKPPPPKTLATYTPEMRALENKMNAQFAAAAENGGVTITRDVARTPNLRQKWEAANGPMQADQDLGHIDGHVVGGSDEFHNLEPQNRRVNRSNGSRVGQALRGKPNGTVITKVNYTVLKGLGAISQIVQMLGAGIYQAEFTKNYGRAPTFNEFLNYMATGDRRSAEEIRDEYYKELARQMKEPI